MDVVMIVLRILHIFAGIYWAGTAFFVTIVVERSINQVGDITIAQGIYRTGLYDKMMAAAAGITTLAGIILYIKIYDSDWLGTSNGIVLTIGAVAGLLAMGHGGAVIAPRGKKFSERSNELAQQHTSLSDEQKQELQALWADIGDHSRISLILMVISILGMVSARYM